MEHKEPILDLNFEYSFFKKVNDGIKNILFCLICQKNTGFENENELKHHIYSKKHQELSKISPLYKHKKIVFSSKINLGKTDSTIEKLENHLKIAIYNIKYDKNNSVKKIRNIIKEIEESLIQISKIKDDIKILNEDLSKAKKNTKDENENLFLNCINGIQNKMEEVPNEIDFIKNEINLIEDNNLESVFDLPRKKLKK